jgi:hypothetical protein
MVSEYVFSAKGTAFTGSLGQCPRKQYVPKCSAQSAIQFYKRQSMPHRVALSALVHKTCLHPWGDAPG